MCTHTAKKDKIAPHSAPLTNAHTLKEELIHSCTHTRAPQFFLFFSSCRRIPQKKPCVCVFFLLHLQHTLFPTLSLTHGTALGKFSLFSFTRKRRACVLPARTRCSAECQKTSSVSQQRTKERTGQGGLLRNDPSFCTHFSCKRHRATACYVPTHTHTGRVFPVTIFRSEKQVSGFSERSRSGSECGRLRSRTLILPCYIKQITCFCCLFLWYALCACAATGLTDWPMLFMLWLLC